MKRSDARPAVRLALAAGLALAAFGCEPMPTAGTEGGYRSYQSREAAGAPTPNEPTVNTGLASLSAQKPPPPLIKGASPAAVDQTHATEVAESARLLDEYFARLDDRSDGAVASRQVPSRTSAYDPSAEVGPTGSSRLARPVEIPGAEPTSAGLARLGETEGPSDTDPAESRAAANIMIEDVPAAQGVARGADRAQGTQMPPVRVVERPQQTTRTAAETALGDDPALSAIEAEFNEGVARGVQGQPVVEGPAVASADGSMAGLPRMPRSPEDRKQELVDELVAVLHELASGGDEPYRAGLALAGLETLSPGALYQLTESGVLMPDETRTLLAAHELFTGLAAGGGTPEPGRVSDLLGEVKERLDEHAPLKIPAAELCTRVLGYGQYDMFPKAPDGSYTFAAGRRQPIIIYVEVDRFGRRPDVGEDGLARWEVALSQELQIYHDADDLLVMARKAETDRSVSRNKIRDYYLINQTYLPENLSVGKYNLKVVMRDENKKAVAEAIIPFSVTPTGGTFTSPQ